MEVMVNVQSPNNEDGFMAPEKCPKCGCPDLIVVSEGGPFSRAAQETYEKRGAPRQQVKLLGWKCVVCGTEAVSD